MMLVIRAHSGQLPTAPDQWRTSCGAGAACARTSRRASLSTADRIITQFDSITAAIGLIAIAISSVSLLVGGSS